MLSNIVLAALIVAAAIAFARSRARRHTAKILWPSRLRHQFDWRTYDRPTYLRVDRRLRAERTPPTGARAYPRRRYTQSRR